MTTRRFQVFLLALVAIYLSLQMIYVARLPLVMDEFAGAREAYRVAHGVPYRDFLPYKTVIGYAIQAVPAHLAETTWSRLMAIKIEIVLINAAMLAIVGVWLSRRYRAPAVLFALAVIICSSTFLERSSELRVDLLTAWAGVVSLLALMDGKPALAGAFAAISFGISQKAALFIMASDISLLALCAQPDRRRSSVKMLVTFNATVLAGIALYVVAWSAVSDLDVVMRQVFGVARDVASITVYSIRWHYWRQVLVRNPAMVAVTAAALWQFGRRIVLGQSTAREMVLAVYAVSMLALAASYAQPWPYFFMILWPTLLVVMVAWMDIASATPAGSIRTAGILTLLAAGVLYPLMRIPVVMKRDNAYQRHTVDVAESLLQSGETYLAATPLLADREQAVERLAWVDAAGIAQLRRDPPAKMREIVTALERHPPKIVIGNYRIYGLPAPIRDWIMARYLRLTASVFTYAPSIAAGSNGVELAYGGRYRVETESLVATIDDQPRRHGAFLELSKGRHGVSSDREVRLRLVPIDIENQMDPRFLAEQDLFPNVYDY
jgi:hypothetical protein